MFVANKYTKTYQAIISRARESSRSKKTDYFESHHVIPRCMGGSDDAENLVLLTAREHFLCHALLCKMIATNTKEWNKLVHAFIAMGRSSSNQQRYFNSRLYNLARREIGKVMSQLQTGQLNSQFATTWMHNLELRISVKVTKSEVDNYINDGYNMGRILDFDKHLKNTEAAFTEKSKRLDAKMQKCEDEIKALQLKLLNLQAEKNLHVSNYLSPGS